MNNLFRIHITVYGNNTKYDYDKIYNGNQLVYNIIDKSIKTIQMSTAVFC